MVSGQRVLVVDGLSETEQVLKAVLEPRGLQVDRIRSGSPLSAAAPRFGSSHAPTKRPNVVVLHEADDVPYQAQWGAVPRVIIGSAHIPEAAADGSPEYLPHPFQYRELIGAIERLLDRRKPEESAA